MKRYEKIEELFAKIDWLELETQERRHPRQMFDIEIVQRACKMQDSAIGKLKESVDVFSELERITGIAIKVERSGYYSQIRCEEDENYLYKTYIPAKIWDGAEEAANPEWDKSSAIGKLERVVEYLEADMTHKDQITFLEEEI